MIYKKTGKIENKTKTKKQNLPRTLPSPRSRHVIEERRIVTNTRRKSRGGTQREPFRANRGQEPPRPKRRNAEQR